MKANSKRLLSWLSVLFFSFGLITAMLIWFASGAPVQAGNVLTVCASGCDYTMIGAAVAAAANGDTILIGAGTYTENITITKVLTLQGDDPSNTIVDGNENGSVFYLTSSAVVTMTDLTVTNGRPIYWGGGVYNSGRLLISNTIFLRNTILNEGDGAGIYNDGTLTVLSSSILSNTTPGLGYGGGIYNTGSLTIVNSIVMSNTAGSGGGVYSNRVAQVDYSFITRNRARDTSGGGVHNESNGSSDGVITITHSTISDNVGGWGGGLHNGSIAYVLNSTISGNHGFSGGGIWSGDTMRLYYSTVSDNSASFAGGVVNFMFSTLNLQGTILANNHTNGNPSNCAGEAFYSENYNLIEDTTGCLITGTVTHNITGVDPQLMPLDYYYFPLPIHPLEKTSPAVDAAAPSGCPIDDQRGAPRPQDGDGDGISICDIGAYEYGYPYAINAYLPLMLKP